MTKQMILVDTSRCVGCWTCAMACHVAHHLETDEYWCYVRTIGDGGIDEPASEYGQQYMSWEPIYTSKCVFCKDRTSEGLLPHCVYNCPTKALLYGDIEDEASEIAKRYRKLLSSGQRIITRMKCEQIPPWVVYFSE